jgi:hypothetical protein
VIERVLGVTHRVPSVAAILLPCLGAAEGLHPLLATARHDELLPEEATRLTEGSHPLAALVRLTDPDVCLTDDVWLELYGLVATAFGKPLAAAAGRSRIEIPPATRRRSSSLPPPHHSHDESGSPQIRTD